MIKRMFEVAEVVACVIVLRSLDVKGLFIME